ncbi:zinc transporter ZupT [Clostridium sp. SHJSY1]|uniref:zinc transporter ZupT n=1 Tax=Clostridium sp. SHJSY1 TaxID=2942483 RepID=UPI00287658F3|nr:zinc transporter ZupT [Clostridium sp. SHJSY1]MDS0524402.1 zinc transporter ZupT [Clostridium sp. SHJSY1]
MFDLRSIIPIFLSLLAGLATVLGAFIVFFSKSGSKRLITFALSFSAGVMITISFTDLFPAAEETLSKNFGKFNGVLLSLLFLIIGVIIALLIDHFIPSQENTLLTNKNNNNLYRVGFVSMIALMLHNFPEGIATYVSGYQSTTLGISIALAISLHNIPEGVSIAMPIYYSTKSKTKAFKYTFLSGMAEPFGAILAFLFLKPYINDVILSIVFGVVAGIMIYISFEELIPESRVYGFNFLYIFSLVLGICIIPISHIFL